MTQNDAGLYKGKHEVIAKFGSSDSNYLPAMVAIILVLLVIYFIIIRLFIQNKLIKPNDILHLTYFVPVLLIVYLVHELIHFFPLWVFSKKKPQLHLTYVLLQQSTSISRKEGIISYLLPFLFIAILSVSLIIFFSPIVQIGLITLIFFHTSLCCYDFIYTFLLLRCRRKNVRLSHEKQKKGFETIFYCDKQYI